MKIRSYFGYLMLICMVFSLTCKKHDADTVFNGSARITGVVLFTNIATNVSDTAKTATITMTQIGNSSANNYITQLTNGAFDINYLKKGAYEFNIKFFYTQPGSTNGDYYTVNQKVTFTNSDQWLDPYNFVLTIDSTSSPTLQIKIVDASKNVISNANVCLYSSLSTLMANQGTCAGSVTSGVTNAEGIVLFEGLQTTQSYYVSAYATLGTNLLSNWSATSSTPVTATHGTTPLANPTDTLQPIGRSLQITVKDQNHALMPNTNVCLYTDQGLLAQYQNTCTGSSMSGVTNSLGIITFNGLQNIQYYISAYQIVGTSLLSNSAQSQSAPFPLLQNDLNPILVTIQPIGPATIFTVNPITNNNAPADGVSTIAISAKINTALLTNAQNIVFTANGGTFGNNMATMTQAADLNGNATVYLKSSMVGTFQISITYDNLTQVIPVTFVPALPDAIVLSAPPTLLDTNSNNSLPVTITLLRNIGTASPGLLFNYTYTATGSLSTPPAGFGLETASSTSGTTSSASFVFSTGSPTYTGTIVITVSLQQKTTISSSVSVQVVN